MKYSLSITLKKLAKKLKICFNLTCDKKVTETLVANPLDLSYFLYWGSVAVCQKSCQNSKKLSK